VRITKVERRPNGTVITYDCGHVGRHNQIYTYRVGERIRCFYCAQHIEALKYNEKPYEWSAITNLVRERN